MRLIVFLIAMAAAAPAFAQSDGAPTPATPEVLQQESRDVVRLLELLAEARARREAEAEEQRRADERLARRNASGTRLLRSQGDGASNVRVSRACSPERPVSAVC